MSYKAVAVHKGEYDSLQHHGVLGMKWGVRRYQNEDGSLTASGRTRYSKPKIPNKYLSPNKSMSSISKRSRQAVQSYMPTRAGGSSIEQMQRHLYHDADHTQVTAALGVYDQARNKQEQRIRDLEAQGGAKLVGAYLSATSYALYTDAADKYSEYVLVATDPESTDKQIADAVESALEALAQARALDDAQDSRRRGYEQYMEPRTTAGERVAESLSQYTDNKGRKPDSMNHKNQRKSSPKGNYTGYGD